MERCDMGLAFKLLCDEYGRVYGVEAGDEQFTKDARAGEVMGTQLESVTLGSPSDNPNIPLAPLTIKEVTMLTATRCCWRFVLGRWCCVPC
jgi:hypothetical protein